MNYFLMDLGALSHELFLLMLNLSRIRDEERIIALFLDALNRRIPGLSLRRRDTHDPETEYCIDASTINGTYARFIIEGEAGVERPEVLTFIRNGVAMLALILENRRQSKLLEIAAEHAINERDRLFQMSADLLCVANMETHFTDLNPAWERTLGWTIDELKSKPYTEFVHPDDRYKTDRAIFSLKNGQPVFTFENRYQCRDGSYRVLNWNSYPVTEEGLVYAVARDVTEQKKMEQALRQAEKMQAIGQLAGGVAHDFNNQLSGIMGYAELLLGRVEDPVLKKYASGILKASSNAAHLISQLMAFSRKQDIEKAPVDMHKVVNDVTELLMHSVDKRIVVRLELQARSAIVLGDAVKLQNVILNIGLNARDAMPTGGTITFTTEDELSDDEDKKNKNWHGNFRLKISDTGTGMNQETLAHIFEPFFTTKEPGRGTGMGLAAALGTIESHGGKLDVESMPGEGTVFSITLPSFRDTWAAGQDSHQKDDTELSGVSILLIDDEDVVLELVTEMLEKLGCVVSAFNNVAGALNHYRENHEKTDVVILDMVMPVMTGRDVYRELVSINENVRVLMISGYTSHGDLREILSHGNSSFLAKPYKMRELLHALTRLLGREHTGESNR